MLIYHILCQIDLSALIGTSTTTVTVNTDSLTLLLWITEPSDKYTPDYLIFTFSIHLSVLTEGLSYSAFVHFLWAGGDLTWRSSFRTFQWWKIPSVSIIFFKPDKMTFLLSFQKHCHLFFFFFDLVASFSSHRCHIFQIVAFSYQISSHAQRVKSKNTHARIFFFFLTERTSASLTCIMCCEWMWGMFSLSFMALWWTTRMTSVIVHSWVSEWQKHVLDC